MIILPLEISYQKVEIKLSILEIAKLLITLSKFVIYVQVQIEESF